MAKAIFRYFFLHCKQRTISTSSMLACARARALGLTDCKAVFMLAGNSRASFQNMKERAHGRTVYRTACLLFQLHRWQFSRRVHIFYTSSLGVCAYVWGLREGKKNESNNKIHLRFTTAYGISKVRIKQTLHD